MNLIVDNNLVYCTRHKAGLVCTLEGVELLEMQRFIKKHTACEPKKKKKIDVYEE